MRELPDAAAYSASKIGGDQADGNLRVEFRPLGLRVVTIAGYIQTPMTEHNPYRCPS
ncbi:hypothetical protein ACU4HD_47585 [Cupriavidus basilensis]